MNFFPDTTDHKTMITANTGDQNEILASTGAMIALVVDLMGMVHQTVTTTTTNRN